MSGRSRAFSARLVATWPEVPVTRMRISSAGFAEPLAGIAGGTDWMPPPFIIEIPANCLFQPAFEALFRAPTKRTFDLGGVDRVTPIMPGPVRHVFDELFVERAPLPRAQAVQNAADRPDDRKIGMLVPTAHIVALANAAAGQDSLDGACMVLDIEPVPYVLPC